MAGSAYSAGYVPRRHGRQAGCQQCAPPLSPAELLELTRHDLLTRLKGSCRVALEALAEHYASDEALLDSVAQEVEWQRYRHRLVVGVLWQGDRLSHMVPYHRQRG